MAAAKHCPLPAAIATARAPFRAARDRRFRGAASCYAAAMFSPAPGAAFGGKYRLERPLAQGGMGAIWVAWQSGLERRVAVKFMARELSSSSLARARFDREARAAAQLRTPHVVLVHDHGIEDDTPYIVMELLEGEDLNSRLRRTRRLPLTDTARIAFQVAKALRRAQEAGLVHRDLKPANVFLAHEDGDEVVKILDFGVARLAEHAGDGGESTRSGVVVGSPHYMSPEQARGLQAVDHRSDLWALAVILFRAVTGAVPFPGNELGDIIIRVWNDPAPAPSELAPDLPPALDAFFARALAKSPADRYQTAPELAAAFAQAAGVTGPSLSSPFDPRASVPSTPGLTPSHVVIATFPTPVSWPGATPSGAPPPSARSPASLRPVEGSGGTLGGSHDLGPRPSSQVPPVVWAAAIAVVAGLGAGALFFALRAPSGAPAAASEAPSVAGTSAVVAASVPVPSVAVSGLPAPPAEVGPAAPSGTGATPNASASTSATSVSPAASSSGVASQGTSSATPGAPSAGAKPPRSGGRRGHDFGY